MSGPVWRRIKEPDQMCDICLEKGDTAFVEGIIESGEFLPRKRLCEECYNNFTENAGSKVG